MPSTKNVGAGVALMVYIPHLNRLLSLYIRLWFYIDKITENPIDGFVVERKQMKE